MLESLWISIPLATALGFLSGLGTGGGSLLILWLTVVLEMDPIQARNINLMFFIPSAVISILFRFKQKQVNITTLLPGIIAGCICAYIASSLSAKIELTMLKKLFGGLLIVTGLRELLYKKKAGH